MNHLAFFAPTKTTFSYRFLSSPFSLVLLGTIFLVAMAQIAVPLPFTPVMLSMLPLAIFLLASHLGSKKASLAVALYLLQATLGLPVFANFASQPLWFLLPKAGYYFGFVFIAYFMGKLFEKFQPFKLIAIGSIFALGEILLLMCGSLWLGYFVGWEKAFLLGAAPFLPGAFVKITIATCVKKFSTCSFLN